MKTNEFTGINKDADEENLFDNFWIFKIIYAQLEGFSIWFHVWKFSIQKSAFTQQLYKLQQLFQFLEINKTLRFFLNILLKMYMRQCF